MTKAILILCLLLTGQLFAQPADSTDIKLRQYKAYFDQGLINTNEYELLKEKLFLLGKFAPVNRVFVSDSGKQYTKKLTFEIRVEPTAFFSVRYVNNYHGISDVNGAYSGHQQNGVLPYGGMTVAVGAAIDKRYHVHAEVAFDGTPGEQVFTTGAGFSYNLLSGKVSPFVHIDGGYATVSGGLQGNYDDNPYKGFYGCTGIGIYAQVSKVCAITLSPDYRLIYGHSKTVYNDYYYNNYGFQSNNSGWEKNNMLNHQIGIRLSAVFY